MSGGSSPRKAGNAVERRVAQLTEGSRIPMSGAVKYGPHNLTGDVTIRDSKGREFIKMEVKMSGTVTAKGDVSYNLKRSVLEQVRTEALATGEIGCLWLHFKNQPYENGYVIMPANDWLRFLELAKTGAGEYD